MLDTLARVGLSLVAAGGVAVGAYFADGSWAGQTVLDVCRLPGNWLNIQRETARDSELEGEREATAERMACKDKIIADVAAGRLALRAAAGQFMQASGSCPYCWDYLADQHPDWPTEKRCACYIIDGVELRLQLAGQDPASVVADLQAEIEEWPAE
jgi:hypothetical protein